MDAKTGLVTALLGDHAIGAGFDVLSKSCNGFLIVQLVWA
ncbi:hypothetical protein BCF44_12319 [Kutzneria buriramensis]|uniref:Uncharacterized protein n=1 Tax=Kutzneria buriramensis TaxID=1045776 RepID=A0A3E0GVD9_9PSEU|nr:hypothetical protein BCF44_12319 [Kutzneria buriramensis]